MDLRKPLELASGRMRQAVTELRDLTAYEVDGGGGAHLLYQPGDEESSWHFSVDLDRMDSFLRLLGTDLHGLRVLDLGANPYILSYTTARDGAHVVANGHRLPDPRGAGPESVEFRTADGSVVLSIPLARF